MMNETDQISLMTNAFFVRYDEVCYKRYENEAQPINIDLQNCPDLYKVADLLPALFAIPKRLVRFHEILMKAHNTLCCDG